MISIDRLITVCFKVGPRKTDNKRETDKSYTQLFNSYSRFIKQKGYMSVCLSEDSTKIEYCVYNTICLYTFFKLLQLLLSSDFAQKTVWPRKKLFLTGPFGKFAQNRIRTTVIV